jgi:hypothetical protein
MRAFFCSVFFSFAAFAADPSTGRKVVFSDDFNGDKIDESKWNISGAREVCAIAKVGKESVLRLGLKTGADMIQTNSVSTRGKFSQQYGYFEASIRMNSGDGHSGTFRIASDDEKTAPSINAVFGSVGKDRVNPWARATLESGQQDYRPEKALPAMKSGDLSKKFHTYGILWSEKGFTWFIDGKPVHKLERKEFTKPMNLAFSHRVLEEDRAKLNLKSLPDDIDIDWVKVWK